jgi:asparagine synthetase B (glutamine-hydrolysing)
MCGIAAWIHHAIRHSNGSESSHSSHGIQLDAVLSALMATAAPSRSAPIPFTPTHLNMHLDAARDLHSALYEVLDAWWREMMQSKDSQSNTHQWIPRRGPDACGHVDIMSVNGESRVRLCGSVLAMRSSPPPTDQSQSTHIIQQPHILNEDHASSSYLCYNGEIYANRSTSSMGPINDTEYMHQKLQTMFNRAATADPVTGEEAAASFEEFIRQLEVECSFIYARKDTGQMIFGKDNVGRRSLLFGQLQVAAASQSHPSAMQVQYLLKQNVFVSSVALPGIEIELSEGPILLECIWAELSPRYLYAVNFSEVSISSNDVCKISRPQRITQSPSESRPSGLSSDDLMLQCLKLLRQSVERRTRYRGCINNTSESLAVLFSGGLDSTVLAALADDCLPPHVALDLINVSFGDSKEDAERGGDRASARKSFQDLLHRSSAPSRLRLILVNVTKAMMNGASDHVRQLTTPLDTVMDLSIAMPLWFAARGDGADHVTEKPSSSNARVILLGGGADEQFGGYSRHRIAFSKGGCAGLEAELHLDMDRIWNRNLGRDDRVVADHGKEGRFPFLDCDLSDWLQTLSLSDICDMSLPPGTGDKRLLRLVATHLGLNTAAALVKRAVQFGSRLTKMVPKGKGTDKLDPE